VFGIGAVLEYIANWSIKPFHLLFWLPVAVSFGKMAMTIPDHLMSRFEQAVVLLNQVLDPVKHSLEIAAVLLTFLAACVKFVKNLSA
jgi:hypothetical protein